MTFNNSVLIYGRSLNLAGIGVCLRNLEGLEVLEIDPSDPDARQCLEALTSEVILFDLTDPPRDLDLAFLRNKPGLLLIGVDPSSDEVLILKDQFGREMSTDALNQLISYQTHHHVVNGA